MSGGGAVPEASAAPAEPPEVAPGGTPDQPVGAEERIVALDFIRGIAVLGILFANVVAYGHPQLAYYWPEALPGGASAFDRAVWLFQLVWVDGKFRGLFTLLFGAGLYLFVERVRARGGTLALQARRLGWLALFGLMHTFLVWTGDILFLYAASGFVALAMLGWSARTQLAVGMAWFVAGTLMLTWLLAAPAVDARAAQGPEESAPVSGAWLIEQAAQERMVMREGSFADIVRYRLAEEGPGLIDETVFIALIETLPLILIGMALLRLGLFSGRFDAAKLRRWGWLAFLGGAALTLPLGLWVMHTGFPLARTQLVFNALTAFFHLPMILGLAALLAQWAPRAAQGWLGRRFVAAGRMAFSNYLGTSLVMMLVFQGWAGGLFGELHRAGLLLFVALGWGLMLAWSSPWLARFRYGPLEWAWRCLTYGRLFALRR